MPDSLKGFVVGTVTKRVDWTNNLFSLHIDAEIDPFQAGQFIKLALKGQDGQWVRRAYSLVNAPSQAGAEVLVIEIPDGGLSPFLGDLNVGDEVFVTQQAAGFMTIAEIPKPSKSLWMLSTGTAIGPFISMLEQERDLDRFEDIVLVHAVRSAPELVYQQQIEVIKQRYGSRFRLCTIVSREIHDGSLRGRIPALLQSGELETKLGLERQTDSFFYLCGNPEMVRDTKLCLEGLGYTKHLRRKPGQYASENYW
ncbi:ferredoxin--NADP reductase [Alginatibacterium sediminis]|uniref:ferredoxin--NADP(+) reductase n=1 Tax=Alginatibacterium sediminis TaxID=2164068 RepID=A0A420EA05_9ALTE|nr:FAD-binding oxidoreductase [Alginatibacterium sediminis]RKF17513.1 ferredoxin--NADP reductase [Alginatibacterium sediminis]